MRNLVLFLGLAAAFVLMAGCSEQQQVAASTPQASEQPQPGSGPAAPDLDIVIPVQAELPKQGNISAYFETTSRIEAEKRVQVMAEGVGYCRKMDVEEGDRVKAGDVLAQLDESELLASIGQAEVQVRQQKTALDIAEKSLAEGIGSKAERDNAKFAYEQGVAALDMQKVRLDKLSIRSPIDGIVTKRNIQLGQLVASGTPLFTIVDPSSFILNINVPENELPRLKIGQAAKITIDALGNHEFDAHVRRINPGVDATTGTVKVTLDFDEGTRQKMRESAFARVRLVMQTHPNALLVPKDALLEENARKYLFVVAKKEDGKEAAQTAAADDPAKQAYVAKRFEIETGLEDSNNVEILSGIDAHSLVVTVGQHTLKPDSLVRLSTAASDLEKNAGMSAEDALKAAKEKAAGEAGKAAANQNSTSK